MTKIGRKGFMLAEVVVVAVVISTVLIGLYTGLNNISSAYETRNRYYDIDSLYVAMEVNDILREKNYISEGLITEAKYINNIDYISNYETFYFNTTNSTISSYITPYAEDKILTLESYDGNTNETFNDYLEYLSGNIDFTENYDYMIIVERRENNDVDDCYYYTLKLNY